MADWREVHDPATGRNYFWKPETNETSWSEPVGVKVMRLPAAAGGAASLTSGASRSKQSFAGGSANGGGAGGGGGVGGGAGAGGPAGGGGSRGGRMKRLSLPPDWQEVLDQATGRVYFWNIRSGKVQWDPPAAAATTSRAKHRGVVCAESYEQDEAFVPRQVPKTEASREVIRRALRSSFLFSSLAKEDMEQMVDAMEKRALDKGEVIIKQGEKGDNFYVVESGHFDIFVNGNKVAARGPGDNFGELALLYNSPRAATVQATSPAVLWALDRVTFRHMIAHTSADKMKEIVAALRKVKLLEPLTDAQLSRVAEAVQIIEYHDSDVIIRKGDQGNTFYMIKTGRVVCTGAGSGSITFADLHLRAGDYFGERALLKAAPRAANVLSVGDTTCMMLDRKAFTELLGPLHELLDYDAAIRVLETVTMLKVLTKAERDRVVHACRTVSYADGDVIAREGGFGSTFYMVKDGVIRVARGGEHVRDLASGDYFGEGALLADVLHDVTYASLGAASMFALDRKEFEDLLGPLRVIMDRGEVPDDEDGVEGGDGAGGKLAGVGAGVGGPTGAVTMRANTSSLLLADLERVEVLGAGTFGVVALVRHVATGAAYALKTLQKAHIIASKQERNVMNEKTIMAMCDHPFILKLYATYKDRNCLHMLLELVQGGELFTLLSNSETGCLPSDHARFYAACVVAALKYMHSLSILYRDLKPENILIDRDGYVKLVDMGFAKVVKDRTFTLCGTPEYLAPELVLGKGHHKGVDYWALGILVYEMLCGYSPFADERGDQMKICKNIVEADLEFPAHVTDKNAKDLVENLLQRDTVARYGCRKNGAKDIQNHMWFSGLDWESLLRKVLQAPWVPPLEDEFDTSHFEVDASDDFDDVEEYDDEVEGAEWHTDF